MNNCRYSDREEDIRTTNSWDAFVEFLETIYFPGAAELLERKLIAFEFEVFKSCYAT